ncbi:MAG: hypothetical protein HYW57_10970 [Ignavibacteriales bacterium]|nr:hypothetical protein [Ignavibacteriales bacterium]
MSIKTTPLFVLFAVSVVTLLHAALFNVQFDDSFISFHYARNLSEGNGLVFTGAGRVEGFSSILWVLLLAAASSLGIPPETASKVFGATAGLGCLLVTFLLSQKIIKNRVISFLPIVLLSASGVFTVWIFSGMESCLAILLLISIPFLIMDDLNPITPSFLLSLLILVRPEGFIYLVPVLLIGLNRRKRGQWYLRMFLLPVLTFGVLTLFRMSYFGDILPNTYYVKSQTPSFEDFVAGLEYLVRFGWTLAGPFALLWVPGMISWYKADKYFAFFAILWGGTTVLFVFLSGGDFFPYFRFAAFQLPTAVIILTAGLDAVYERMKQQRFGTKPMPASLIALAVGAGLLAFAVRGSVRGKEHRVFHEWEKAEVFRTEVGRWLGATADKQWMMAINPSGIIPYYSGLKTIDMLGLNNRHIARKGSLNRQLQVGHRKGDGRYVLESQPNLLILGSVTPTDHFQTGVIDSSSMLVSDRQIVSSEEFKEQYRDTVVQLPSSGELFRFFIRNENQKVSSSSR